MCEKILHSAISISCLDISSIEARIEGIRAQELTKTDVTRFLTRTSLLQHLSDAVTCLIQ